MFEVGDKVRFVGDKERYLKSFHSILNRQGVVIKSLRKGLVHVRWVPKTKRGVIEWHHHSPEELEGITDNTSEKL